MFRHLSENVRKLQQENETENFLGKIHFSQYKKVIESEGESKYINLKQYESESPD